MRHVAVLLVAVLAVLLGVPTPAVFAQGGDPVARLAAEIQAETRKVTEHNQRKPQLRAQVDVHNEQVVALNEQVTVLEQKAAAYSRKVSVLEARIGAHNAKPRQFQLPQQAAAAAAYNAEAAQLNTEKNQLNAESAGLQSEKAQQDQRRAQLKAEEQQQRAQISAFNQEGARLAAECQQLLQQAAVLLDAPPPPPPVAPGGDQGRPIAAPGQPRQVAGDGGDPVSRRPQSRALDEYAKQHGVDVDKRQVWARMSPNAVANLPASARTHLQVTRTYDGLVPKPNGNYKALEVPSATTGTSPGNKGFDEAIKAGGEAIASVDGRRIVIDEVERVPAPPAAPPTAAPPPANCGTSCNLVSDGKPTTATVGPQKLLDDARALHDTVSAARDRYVTVATGQLGGRLVYAVNQNGTNEKMRALAAQLGYERVFATDLNPGIDTDAEQILYNAIDEGEYLGDGLIASSRPACGPDRQDCAGRAIDYPNVQLWDQPRKR
ncbi:hypothetical protein AOZ06_16740 [Kibdelosporangium phytohabitans]|uniref:Chromosome partition protein Smc n=2 Tax=Kibdelosporangium phytohabitans TaxID=860235 RepID=A0A0N9HXS6_9PSEU|nr:hypothetical protein AOZ06_16740 [Kibdelosporangium phytohabitans]